MSRPGDNPMNRLERSAWEGLLCIAALASDTETKAGWFRNKERNFGACVALMHSELSEALEADRKGLMDDHIPELDGRAVEFADCIIRIMATAHALDLDVAGALIAKNRYNRSRIDHNETTRTKKY